MPGEPTLSELAERLRLAARKAKRQEREARETARELMELRSQLTTALAAKGIHLVTEPQEAK